ncbi:MAG: hypothetical protein JWO02_1231 [Solirubrobacterales bacterium]|nr:hypothetical protein [Solirubrobacterales bacterium]
MTLVVAGGGIAALVAADAAASAGQAVELLLPHTGVGGGFAPLVLDGRRLDRGLRALELRYEDVGEPPPLHEYDAAGAGHRPYARRIEAYVRELMGNAVVELDRPRMWLHGYLGDELLVTTDLSRLRECLTGPEALAILEQTTGDDGGLLGAGRPEALWNTSMTTASIAQHGRTLHDLLIAAFAQKIRPEGTDDVPVALRRKLWLPLFHPRTVREAAAGAPVSFRPERPLHSIEPDGTGAIITRLLARLRAAPTMRIRRVDGFEHVATDGDRVRITLRGGARVVARDPILALAPGQLFAAAGVPYAPDRVTSVLAWVQVRQDDVLELPCFVHVIDPDIRIFRLSRGEVHGERVAICVELAHDITKDAAPAVAAAALERLGIVREGAQTVGLAAFAGPTFTAPTFANVTRFTAARAAYDALRIPARTIGGSEAFGADALNEQLIQGLAAAAASATGAVRAA